MQETDYDLWIYISFYVVTTGATIGIHSVRRASSSRINLLTSEVGSGGTVTPTSFSSTVRLYFIFLPYQMSKQLR